MAFNANASGSQIIEYTPDDTYSALINALNKSEHYTIKEANKLSRTAVVRTGVSWKSWGENLIISISPASDGFSSLSISSSSKYGLIDWGKNQENLSSILGLLSSELSKYQKVLVEKELPLDDIPTQIKKLSELKNAGILTENEFEEKKKELLAKM